MSVSVGVDIGGTKILAGAVSSEGEILGTVRHPSPVDSYPDLIKAIALAVHEAGKGHDIAAVGVGVAGQVTFEGTVLSSPNLGLFNAPLRRDLTAELGVPIVVDNDANVAAYGEYRCGAGAGESSLLLITVGTGIGMGLVIDGEIFRGKAGLAGEPGHIIVESGGRLCTCGHRGCWERYSSGSALRDAADQFGSPHALLLAAEEGNVQALEAYEIVGRWLGKGLATLAAVLDPGLILIGGGVSEAGEVIMGPARDEFGLQLTGRDQRPRIKVELAALGEEAAVAGAALLATHRWH